MQRLGLLLAALRFSFSTVLTPTRAHLSIVIGTTILIVAPALPAQAENAVITRAIEGFIRPAYGEFKQATMALESKIKPLCTAPGEPNLAAARTDFLAAVRSWSRIEGIRFGPVTEENRLERILFWPDRKSIGLKQVQAAIADEDASAADVTSLAGKSVAMQGLGALEFVLFGTGSDDLLGTAGAYRCRYGLAVAGNLAAMAGQIDTAWNAPSGIAAQWANPGAENPLYRNDAEAMTELFNVFVHGVEMIRDVRINGFLGETAEDDKPRQAIFWRSEATVLSIANGLDGLQQMFEVADMSGLLSEENAWIPRSIAFEFGNAERALEAVDEPIAAALEDTDKRKKLDYARLVTSSLSELFGVRLASALGLSAGFSSLDGD